MGITDDRTMLAAEIEEKFFVTVANRGSLKVYEISGDMYMGRDTSSIHNDIPLEGKYISRRHGIFHADKHECFFTNLGRPGCAHHNGLGLKENEKVRVNNGDVIRLEECYAHGAGESVTVFVSVSWGNPPEWKVYDLADFGSIITIGRGAEADIDINDKLVSRIQSHIFVLNEVVKLSEDQGKNKMVLNGDISAGGMPIYDCDCITVGNSAIIYMNGCVYVSTNTQKLPSDLPENYRRSAVDGTPLKIDIDQRVAANKGKAVTLLKDIHVTVKAGEMVLILGGSGAGKTTFMNAVMGYEKADGRIVYGDTDIYSEFETMKSRIGFVPQQDLLRYGDTVYDTLRNAAEMKLRGIDRHERDRHIYEVLNTLGLLREKDSLVSKLSGGQRKRLSIAVEYIADPELFFLDEPDSGLDGIMATLLMENLRTIADEGKMVMVISHAADRAPIYFDKVIVLAKSQEDNAGHLAFFGNVPETYEFFGTDSFEGVVRRINRADEGGDGRADHYIQKFMIERTHLI